MILWLRSKIDSILLIVLILLAVSAVFMATKNALPVAHGICYLCHGVDSGCACFLVGSGWTECNEVFWGNYHVGCQTSGSPCSV